ncbi:MAG: carbamoyl transferase [Gammaproteobacteria bacterium]|nr:carbamoyl transferase [Gammaproteobacteria bacterium]
MIILGLTAGTHDTSAALLVDGQIEIAIEEERLSRNKHTNAFPILAIEACLQHQKISINDVDIISICWDLREIYEQRYIKQLFDHDFSKLIDDRKDEILRFSEIVDKIRALDYQGEIRYEKHHFCHTIYSYASSHFNDCAFITLDGYGETESGYIGRIINNQMEFYKSFDIDNSLGLLYTAITYFLGFKTHCDEGIVMGLASYGDADALIDEQISYLDIFRKIISLNDDNLYHIDRSYFLFGLRKQGWVSKKFIEQFGLNRQADEELTQHHKNIASALQIRIEEVIQHIANKLYEKYQLDQLCLSGGLALNCVANGQLYLTTAYKNIHIPSAPADNGLSIGAALFTNSQFQFNKITDSAYLGPVYNEQEISASIKAIANNKQLKIKEVNDHHEIAQLLMDGKILAVCHGRSEFGPRALGNRSILSRPFPLSMKNHLNNRVKFREDFRPFAPVVLEEHAEDYFDIRGDDHNMTKTYHSNKDNADKIPAALHVDGSGRVQTVNKEQNDVLYQIINCFYQLSGIPVILNTSFNVKGQPIVETPDDAIQTFLTTNIDTLFIGNKYLILKADSYVKN